MTFVAKRLLQECWRSSSLNNEVRTAFVAFYSKGQSGRSTTESSKRVKLYMVAGAGLAVGASLYLYNTENDYNLHAADASKVGKYIQGLPTYNSAEVSKHSEGKSIWISYKEGVYDITKFVKLHPGGDQILMAAGGDVEPFWVLYSIHKRPEILQMMEKYRIGNLDPEDVITGSDDDPYGCDPRRHPALKPASVKPFNAEPSPELLVESFYTPQELFYVRNHLPVPDIDIKTYELEVSGVGIKSKTFKMEDLKKMPKTTITATVQCAGNRRSEMSKVKAVKGLNWGHAAIGNATWTGVKLSDLLRKLGYKEGSKVNHVQFEGLDTDPASNPYGASIPIEKAIDQNGGVLLAYEMNGAPLSRDHGFPLRVIVPGVAGARNVKWLGRIELSEKESESHWQQNDYKGFSPSVDWDTVDFSKSPAIQEMPVTSAICSPKDGDKVKLVGNKLTVKGYAWSGGGKKIVRVDVTADGGKSWHTAELHQDPEKHPYHWGWTLWTLKLPVDPSKKVFEIWAKAVDSSYNSQPESFANIWNLRGVLSNAYHRISVTIR